MDTKTKQLIKQDFLNGQLLTQSSNPNTGAVSWSIVEDVHQHSSAHKECVEVILVDHRKATFTTDHSLFFKKGNGLVSIEAGQISPGDLIATILNDTLVFIEVDVVQPVISENFTYDLAVPGDQNFTLTNGILAHNSYSIGGISLDISKASQYESLKQSAESQFQQATDTKQQTVKIIRGLRQNKYGVGIKSAFGPHSSKGVLSPRKFV